MILMYFSQFQQVQVKMKAFQAGRLLTHLIQSNGVVCKGENVCHSKEWSILENSMITKKKKKVDPLGKVTWTWNMYSSSNKLNHTTWYARECSVPQPSFCTSQNLMLLASTVGSFVLYGMKNQWPQCKKANLGRNLSTLLQSVGRRYIPTFDEILSSLSCHHVRGQRQTTQWLY